MSEDLIEVKNLPLMQKFLEAKSYFVCNWKVMSVFAFLNFVLFGSAVYFLEGFQHGASLVVLGALYLLWCVFFRLYFEKFPLFEFKPYMRSLIPSSKVLFLSVMVMMILLMLVPYVPFLLKLFKSYGDVNDFHLDDYFFFLQKYMQDSHVLDVVLNVVLIFFMPLILYRPFLAWIAALLGRKGSLRLAWRKTKGNYWTFVVMALFMNLPFMLLYFLAELSPLDRKTHV